MNRVILQNKKNFKKSELITLFDFAKIYQKIYDFQNFDLKSEFNEFIILIFNKFKIFQENEEIYNYNLEIINDLVLKIF